MCIQYLLQLGEVEFADICALHLALLPIRHKSFGDVFEIARQGFDFIRGGEGYLDHLVSVVGVLFPGSAKVLAPFEYIKSSSDLLLLKRKPKAIFGLF